MPNLPWAGPYEVVIWGLFEVFFSWDPLYVPQEKQTNPHMLNWTFCFLKKSTHCTHLGPIRQKNQKVINTFESAPSGSIFSKTGSFSPFPHLFWTRIRVATREMLDKSCRSLMLSIWILLNTHCTHFVQKLSPRSRCGKTLAILVRFNSFWRRKFVVAAKDMQVSNYHSFNLCNWVLITT